MNKPTVSTMNKFIDNYGKSAYHLKQLKLADLPDSKNVSMCIRLSPDIITGRNWLLMYLQFLDACDREKSRGMMR
jgi:hypothetical protein